MKFTNRGRVERKEKTNKNQLRARKKGKNDRAGAGQELDPGFVGTQGCPYESADDQLRHGADNDFRERRGDPEPDGKKSPEC